MSANGYANLIFFRYISTDEFVTEFGRDWKAASETEAFFKNVMARLFAERGFDVSETFDELALNNILSFVQTGILRVEGDSYTGTYYKLRPTITKQITEQYFANDEVAKRVSALGEFALEIAIRRLASEQSWPQFDDSERLLQNAANETAPASDRIVTFSDNQSSELEGMTNEIIDSVAAQNQLGEEPGLREIILGQIRAGRELIRAGSARLYLIELTLLNSLRYLAKRYEREAIGGLAAALIAALLKHIGIVS